MHWFPRAARAYFHRLEMLNPEKHFSSVLKSWTTCDIKVPCSLQRPHQKSLYSLLSFLLTALGTPCGMGHGWYPVSAPACLCIHSSVEDTVDLNLVSDSDWGVPCWIHNLDAAIMMSLRWAATGKPFSASWPHWRKLAFLGWECNAEIQHFA